MKALVGKRLGMVLDGYPVLRDVDIQLQRGMMAGIIGPNGAGKTTLLKLLAGLWKQFEGTLELDGQPLSHFSPDWRAQKIAYLAQNGTAYWPINVERIVALGRLPHLGAWQQPDAGDEQVIHTVMEQTGLLNLRRRSFNTLSGGERARVLLARALASEPELLLVDEPVAALDLAHQLEVMALLKRQCDSGSTVAVVLHDLRLANHYCDRLHLIVEGTTLADGRPSEVLTTTHLERAYGITLRSDIPSVADAFALTWERTKGSA